MSLLRLDCLGPRTWTVSRRYPFRVTYRFRLRARLGSCARLGRTVPHGHGLLDSPLTHSPLTHSPVTHSPVTRSPVTRSPLTHSPLTHSPLTHSGLTGEPHSLTLPSIHRCTSLERLDIGGCQRVRGEEVSAVMAACLSLTDLDVTQVGRLGFHSLAQMSVTDSDVAR